MSLFPSPIGELHFSIQCFRHIHFLHIISVPYRGATFLNWIQHLYSSSFANFRPLSGSYISQFFTYICMSPAFAFPSPIGELHFSIVITHNIKPTTTSLSVPYRGATFLNDKKMITDRISTPFPSPIGELHFSIGGSVNTIQKSMNSFRPLSGSYISQYHPRNPMSCLGRIGGLRGKSNFIEIQPFWKVKSSHKSNI